MYPENNSANQQKQRKSKLINIAAGMVIAGIAMVFLAGFLEETSEVAAEGILKIGCTLVVFAPLIAIAALIGISLNSNLTGKGTAIAVLISALFFLLVGAVGFSTVRPFAYRMVCGANLTGLGKALQVYANDYNDVLPTSTKWCDLLVLYSDVSPGQFVCRGTDTKKGESAYAMNNAVSGLKINEIPKDMVVLFETDSGKTLQGRASDVKLRQFVKHADWALSSGKVYEHRWNQVGGPELLSISHHDEEGCWVLLGNFEAEWVPRSALPKLRWVVENATWVFPMHVLPPERTYPWRMPLLIGLAALVVIATVWPAIAFKVWQCWIGALIIGVLSAGCGALLGVAAEDLYGPGLYPGFGYFGAWLGVLLGIVFVPFVNGMAAHVSEGRLRLFSVSTGMAVGALCSTLLHLGLMIVRLEPLPVSLIAGLPFGILAGAILGAITSGIIRKYYLDTKGTCCETGAHEN